jgi:hypothetical protein
VASEVTLQAPAGFTLSFALGDPALQVGLGAGVTLAPDADGLVERPVQLAVTAAVDPVSGLVLP